MLFGYLLPYFSVKIPPLLIILTDDASIHLLTFDIISFTFVF
jgi:hypothetical protein